MRILPDHDMPHVVNIVVHVIFGSAALLLGMGALLSAKGGSVHRRLGRWFLYTMGVVLATAVAGLLVFNFRAFLAVVTLLSFYDAFSGIRALQLRGGRPRSLDRVVSVLGLLAPVAFVMLMRRLHRPWAPVLTYSILGALLAWSLYDLARNVLPKDWLQRVWRQEHLAKMSAAYIAMTSAFAGTVFPTYLPWSAIAPSVAGIVAIVAFLLRGPRSWNKSTEFSKSRTASGRPMEVASRTTSP
jgi:uncharacterized membrane protein